MPQTMAPAQTPPSVITNIIITISAQQTNTIVMTKDEKLILLTKGFKNKHTKCIELLSKIICVTKNTNNNTVLQKKLKSWHTYSILAK